MSTIFETAPAKINLFLHITGRRPDGYHLIQSLFAFTRTGDDISVEAADDISLKVTGPFADALREQGADAKNNIVLKAAHMLRDCFGDPEMGARIRLEKNLPVASGIGGGSSDAAAAIRALVRLWNIQADNTQLSDLALELGADVPACLYGKPCLVEGIGEKITPLANFPAIWCLLVNPGLAVSTKDIFENFARSGCGFSPQLGVKDFLSTGSVQEELLKTGNDLEEPACSLVPEIVTVLDEMRASNGAGIARMSGSGATCFALFDEKQLLVDAVRYIRKNYADWWVWQDEIAFRDQTG